MNPGVGPGPGGPGGGPGGVSAGVVAGQVENIVVPSGISNANVNQNANVSAEGQHQILPLLLTRPPSLTPNSNDPNDQSDHEIIEQVISLEDDYSETAGIMQSASIAAPSLAGGSGDITTITGGPVVGDSKNQFHSNSAEDLYNLFMDYDTGGTTGGQPSGGQHHLGGHSGPVNSTSISNTTSATATFPDAERMRIEKIREQLKSCEVVQSESSSPMCPINQHPACPPQHLQQQPQQHHPLHPHHPQQQLNHPHAQQTPVSTMHVMHSHTHAQSHSHPHPHHAPPPHHHGHQQHSHHPHQHPHQPHQPVMHPNQHQQVHQPVHQQHQHPHQHTHQQQHHIQQSPMMNQHQDQHQHQHMQVQMQAPTSAVAPPTGVGGGGHYSPLPPQPLSGTQPSHAPPVRPMVSSSSYGPPNVTTHTIASSGQSSYGVCKQQQYQPQQQFSPADTLGVGTMVQQPPPEASPVVRKNPLLNAHLANKTKVATGAPPIIGPNSTTLRYVNVTSPTTSAATPVTANIGVVAPITNSQSTAPSLSATTNVVHQNPILNAKLSGVFAPNPSSPAPTASPGGAPVQSQKQPPGQSRYVQHQHHHHHSSMAPTQNTYNTYDPSQQHHQQLYGLDSASHQQQPHNQQQVYGRNVNVSMATTMANNITNTSGSGATVSHQVKEGLRRKVSSQQQQQQQPKQEQPSLLKQLLSDDK